MNREKYEKKSLYFDKRGNLVFNRTERKPLMATETDFIEKVIILHKIKAIYLLEKWFKLSISCFEIIFQLHDMLFNCIKLTVIDCSIFF